MKQVVIKSGSNVIMGDFDKEFKNDRYHLLFNTQTGYEVLYGRDQNPDPFFLDLPSMCDIGIMGHCHNKCGICYQGNEKQPHMRLRDFKRIIDEVKHHTNQVALGGRGDPNLHPKFKEIIEYCRENNVVPNYTTSGKSLTDEHIEISKLCGAVAVSSYGKSFTFQAIQRFIEAGIKTNIHFVLTKGSFFDAISLLYGYNPWPVYKSRYNYKTTKVDLEKINAVVFLLFKPHGRGANKEFLCPSLYQMKIFSELITSAKCSFKVGMDSCLVNHVIKHVEIPEHQMIALDTCESSRMSTYITPDMKLVPCSFADHEKMGVDLKQRSIEDAWNNSKPFRKFRRILKQNPNCCPAGY